MIMACWIGNKSPTIYSTSTMPDRICPKNNEKKTWNLTQFLKSSAENKR